ncbi:MAG: hypothetical protein JJ958_11790 [Balneola sp.]|nr:hypothetical protein [Balneola sp.]
MDSKNIFIACSAMLQKAVWDKVSVDSEWYYLGEGEEFKTDLFETKINKFFPEASIYLVTDRHRSKEIPKANAVQEIQNAILEFSEPTICDKEFKRFITFNKIGVAKHGVFGT